MDTIEAAVADMAQGRFVIAVDNEDRENEGDLILAAAHATPAALAFLIRYSSGYVCAPMLGGVLDRLQLPLMVARDGNADHFGTAYTVTVDARDGTTTGISAHDRATTLRALAAAAAAVAASAAATATATATADPLPAFRRPGHVVPLRYHPRGVLARPGHTEASVDLCRLAGLPPVAAIGEVVLDNGAMARRDALLRFGRRHGIRVITIAALADYIRQHPLPADAAETA
ncbi:hypothetical protein CXG81DRAFT_29822 [Caulochytrium protostelioides]|uniref:3,4-dihydroxy-2-butanone 4-phosphate synthase n=1 Tax=Caulochytrium protostelioides TaxID=1555241 RepID=A0A4P9X7D4_9FUNG|nr:hypothetical protein CXG81DRAFT_29822 [Caulochytrium protostelioides]|eukprot:RKP01122.1 hypothetical protein CXG81DRAFT_29822 [Caulochytrium protostelioides]